MNEIAITRTYETLYIVNPNITDDQLPAVIDKFNQVIVNNGGEIIIADKWEKRRLAYEVAGYRDGTYVLMYFNSEPQVIKELDRVMRISEEVIRHLIVVDEGKLAAAAKERATRPQQVAAPVAPAPAPAPVAEEASAPEVTETPAEPAAEAAEPVTTEEAPQAQPEEAAGEQATE